MSGITRDAFGEVRKLAKSASFDERVTRKRVDMLEGWANTVQTHMDLGLWGRLRWLFWGS